MKSRAFCSKILLFGEYAILSGSQGLAIPMQHYSGRLQMSPLASGPRPFSLDGFIEFISHSAVLREVLDVEKLEEDFKQGLIFESNITPGTGLGSSGALCAAIYDTYSHNRYRREDYQQEDIPLLMDHMSLMESYYHGSSSGLDPLVSLLERPLLVKSRKQVQFVDVERSLLERFSLFQAASQRKTALLVQRFLQLCEEEEYLVRVKKFKQLTDQAINFILTKDIENFEKIFVQISQWQFEHMSDMICEEVRSLWLKGLDSQDYFLKLCGAGGGGHYIVYKNSQASDNLSHFNNLKKLLL